MLTPAKAAQIAQVSRTTVMNAIKSSDLHAVRDNKNRWQIDENDLKQWSGFTDSVSLKVTERVMKASDNTSEIAVLRSELAGRDRVIEILERELAHAKKPFWKRWR
jgi:predicted site-specific integrase-resolvase